MINPIPFLIWFLMSINVTYPERIAIDFSNYEIGIQSYWEVKKWFPNSELGGGKIDKLKFFFFKDYRNCLIIQKGENGANELRLSYPANHFGPTPGLTWFLPIKPNDSFSCELIIKLDSGFDFVKGGKLFGFAGGAGNSGGRVPTGYDGFSARLMFWKEGRVCLYFYHPNQPGVFGDTVFFKFDNKSFILPKNKWIRLGLIVVLNKPGMSNGSILGLVNGVVAAKRENIVLRMTNRIKIDRFLINYFFGGDNTSYAPKQNISFSIKEISVTPVSPQLLH